MALIFESVILDVLAGVAVFFVILYFYMTRNYNVWKKKGIYYLKPLPFFGNMLEVLVQKHSIGSYIRKVYEDTPGEPYIGIYGLDRLILILRDLDVVRCIMAKDAQFFLDRTIEPGSDYEPVVARNLFNEKGKKWRHLRVKMTPTFTSGKMKKMFYLVDDCGQQLVNMIDQEASAGKSVAAKEAMARYSTDVIASCAFGVNANAMKDGNCEFRRMLRHFAELNFVQGLALNLTMVMPNLLKLLRIRTMDTGMIEFVRRTLWDVVDCRKKSGVVRKDFVDLLMQMRDGDDIVVEDARDMEEIKRANDQTNIGYTTKIEKANIKLDGDDFVAQAFVFLIAGFETSSTVLNFTLYELALNPHIQDKLRQEIVSVLDKHGGKVSYDCFSDMPYLEMVVSETLRKYPTLPFLERKCLADYKVPGTDFVIPKDTTVMIPLWAIGNDPKVYPDPDKYDPERFTPENKSKRHHFAHIPFGEGPRVCIGMRFGQMQVKTALAHVLSNFQVRPCAATPKPPLVMKNFGVTLIPRDDIPLTFTRLHN